MQPLRLVLRLLGVVHKLPDSVTRRIRLFPTSFLSL